MVSQPIRGSLPLTGAVAYWREADYCVVIYRLWCNQAIRHLTANNSGLTFNQCSDCTCTTVIAVCDNSLSMRMICTYWQNMMTMYHVKVSRAFSSTLLYDDAYILIYSRRSWEQKQTLSCTTAAYLNDKA